MALGLESTSQISFPKAKQMTDKKTARFERFSEKCPECGGHGTITRWYGGGQFVSTIDCDRCLGRGAIGNCTLCKGTGFIEDEGSTGTKSPAPSVECQACLGSGSIGDCPHCGGTGVTKSDSDEECRECNGFGFLDAGDGQ